MLGAQLIFKVPDIYVCNYYMALFSPEYNFAGEFSSLEWWISFAVWKFFHHYPTTSLRVSEWVWVPNKTVNTSCLIEWLIVGELKSEWQVVCQCLSKYPWIHLIVAGPIKEV